MSVRSLIWLVLWTMVVAGCLGSESNDQDEGPMEEPTSDPPKPGVGTNGTDESGPPGEDSDEDHLVPSMRTIYTNEPRRFRITADEPIRFRLVANESLSITYLAVRGNAPAIALLRPVNATNAEPLDCRAEDNHEAVWAFNESGAFSEPGDERPPGNYVVEVAAATIDGPARFEVEIAFGEAEGEPTPFTGSKSNRTAVSVFGMGELGEEAAFNLSLELRNPSWLVGWFSAAHAVAAGPYELSGVIAKEEGKACAEKQDSGSALFLGVAGNSPGGLTMATARVPSGSYYWAGDFSATAEVPLNYNAFFFGLG